MGYEISLTYSEERNDAHLYYEPERKPLPQTAPDYIEALEIAMRELVRRGNDKYVIDGKITINGAINSYYGLAGKHLKGRKRTIVIHLDQYNAIRVQGDN
jgi:hypothetical protein